MSVNAKTPLPELPPEVVDHILDFLAPGTAESSIACTRETLASCTLVRKTWVPRSSHHLLHTVYISATDTFSQDLAFAAASPRLQAHVRALCVTGQLDASVHLAGMYASLPHLRRLEFRKNWMNVFAQPEGYVPPRVASNYRSIAYCDSGPGSPRGARTGVYAIDELVLSHTSFHLVPFFLRPFRKVTILELDSLEKPIPERGHPRHILERYVDWRERYKVSFSTALPLPSAGTEVDTLVLYGSGRARTTVIASLTAFQARKVVLKDISNGALRLLLCLLRDSGQNVEELVLVITQKFPALNPNYWERGPCPSHEVILLPNSCPGLHTITLDIRYSQANSRRCRTALWHLPSSTLHTLVIKLCRRQLVKTLRDIAAALHAPEQNYRELETIELRGLGDGRKLSPRSVAIIDQHVDKELGRDFHGRVVVFS